MSNDTEFRKYTVTVDTTNVEGNQTFSVLANSATEALIKYKSGKYIDIIDQQLEVTGLSHHDFIVEEVESHESELPVYTQGDMDAHEGHLHDMTHVVNELTEMMNHVYPAVRAAYKQSTVDVDWIKFNELLNKINNKGGE